MTFAKLAADDLMSDPAEQERQEKHRKWRTLLGTVGALGAGGAGAYYLAKHLNQPTQPTGFLDKMETELGMKPGGHAGTAAGALTGGIGGWMAPGSTEGRTPDNLVRNASNTQHPVAANFASLNQDKGVQGGVGMKNMLTEASRPIDPNAAKADVSKAPWAAQVASLGATPKPVTRNPLTWGNALTNRLGAKPGPVQPLDPANMAHYRRLLAGMDTVARSADGTTFKTPSGDIARNDLEAGAKSMTGLDTGGMKTFLEGQKGVSTFGSPLHVSGTRTLSGLLGAGIGGYLGSKFNPPPETAPQ